MPIPAIGVEAARRIKHLRIELELSQTELAVRAGLDRETIYKLERGLTKRPRLETLGRIANAVGRPGYFDDLL